MKNSIRLAIQQADMRTRQKHVLVLSPRLVPASVQERCHTLYRKALRNGTLIRPSRCSYCGSTRFIEGHHEDYTLPLLVQWLCRSCHQSGHGRGNARHGAEMGLGCIDNVRVAP